MIHVRVSKLYGLSSDPTISEIWRCGVNQSTAFKLVYNVSGVISIRDVCISRQSDSVWLNLFSEKVGF